MVKQQYPRVEINLGYLTENTKTIVDICSKYNINVFGVMKGTTGLPECSLAMAKGGIAGIASSRLEQIEDAINIGVNIPTMLIRVAMPSEVAEVVRLCDYSLQSDEHTLDLLNQAAIAAGKTHKVIIMADLGDLREGFWDKDDMMRVCQRVENEMAGLILAGVGTNLGCYGSVAATAPKLKELVALAERVEALIGRELEIISGGATTSMGRIFDGDIPERINQLRLGETILLANDLQRFSGYDMSFMHQDIYTLKAEVLESREKPTYPVGQLTHDAFGRSPVYEDRGIRKRALLGMGKVDYGAIDQIRPYDPKITILGASSDHTIIDIEDVDYPVHSGDIISFKMNYAALIYVTNCRNVQVVYV